MIDLFHKIGVTFYICDLFLNISSQNGTTVMLDVGTCWLALKATNVCILRYYQYSSEREWIVNLKGFCCFE